MYNAAMQVRDVGELELIRAIRSRAGRRNRSVRVSVGDDACLLGDGTVLTIDAYVANVDFRLDYMTMRDVGRRVTCAALSDIAAMAARPIGVVVSLILPGNLAVRQLDLAYQGIEEVMRRFGAEVCGGDVSAGRELVLVIAALGRTTRPLLRSRARTGDLVYMTGYAGLAEAGRLVLARDLPRRGYPASVRRHLAPWPRIEESLRLARWVRAGIDLSDGLATDAAHLAEESGCAVELWPDRLPVHPETRRVCSRLGLDTERFVLGAGEDYELLVTGPARPARRVGVTLLSPIGRVLPGRGVWVNRRGVRRRLRAHGYEHFRTR